MFENHHLWIEKLYLISKWLINHEQNSLKNFSNSNGKPTIKPQNRAHSKSSMCSILQPYCDPAFWDLEILKLAFVLSYGYILISGIKLRFFFFHFHFIFIGLRNFEFFFEIFFFRNSFNKQNVPKNHQWKSFPNLSNPGLAHNSAEEWSICSILLLNCGSTLESQIFVGYLVGYG